MKTKQLIVWLFLVSITPLFITGCHKTQSGLPTDGAFGNRTYTNSYFGFAFPLPPDWIVVEKEITGSIQTNVAQGMIAKVTENHPDRTTGVEEIASRMRILFMVSRHPAGSSSNANIVFMAMPSSHGMKKLSSRDVIRNVDRGMKSRGTRLEPINEIHLGGKPFFHAAYSKPAGESVSQQDCFTMVRGNYALIIILTGLNDGDRKELSDLLSHIDFATN